MKLIMTMGLPGSGKSTWAADQVLQALSVGETVVVVNKDDIRIELGGWKKEREGLVQEIRNARILYALKHGHSVISSDTNFARTHRTTLERIAREYHAEFIVQRFPVAIEECVRRDSLRPDGLRVGPDVIYGMVKQFNLATDPTWYGVDPTAHIPPYAFKLGLPYVVISDLDGTLALHDGLRSPYEEEKCEVDRLNLPVALTVASLSKNPNVAEIIYVSGRRDSAREQTQRWLRHHGLPVGPLFMRATGDTRKDFIVKSEIFEAEIRGRYNVLLVLDDREQVVKFWRRLGLTVFQVAPGDF